MSHRASFCVPSITAGCSHCHGNCNIRGQLSSGPQSAHPQWGGFPMLQLQNRAWMVTHVCMTGLASAGQRGMFTGELIPQAVDPVPAQGGGHGVKVSLGSGEKGCASERGRVERA